MVYGSYRLWNNGDLHITSKTALLPRQNDHVKQWFTWTCIYTLSLSNDIQFTNCTTRKPLFYDLYESEESCGSWTCIYTLSLSNDIQFTTVRLVNHCFTTHTNRAKRKSHYTGRISSCILDSPPFCLNQVLILIRCIYMTKAERSVSKQGHLSGKRWNRLFSFSTLAYYLIITKLNL